MEMYTQIQNPVSKKYIYIGGDTYQKLLRTYTEEQLLSQPTKQTHRKPKSPKVLTYKIPSQKRLTSLSSLPTEVLTIEIIYKLDVKTILELCQISTYYHQFCNKQLWLFIYKRDYEETGMHQLVQEPYTLVKTCYQLTTLNSWLKQFNKN